MLELLVGVAILIVCLYSFIVMAKVTLEATAEVIRQFRSLIKK